MSTAPIPAPRVWIEAVVLGDWARWIGEKGEFGSMTGFEASGSVSRIQYHGGCRERCGETGHLQRRKELTDDSESGDQRIWRIGRNVLRSIAEWGRSAIEVATNDVGPVETNATCCATTRYTEGRHWKSSSRAIRWDIGLGPMKSAKKQPLFSNTRSIRNALDRMRLRQANRLFADLDRNLGADNVMSLDGSDVLASRSSLHPAAVPEVEQGTAAMSEGITQV